MAHSEAMQLSGVEMQLEKSTLDGITFSQIGY